MSLLEQFGRKISRWLVGVLVIDHTTKIGMKDLLNDQQWCVERDSILIPLESGQIWTSETISVEHISVMTETGGGKEKIPA